MKTNMQDITCIAIFAILFFYIYLISKSNNFFLFTKSLKDSTNNLKNKIFSLYIFVRSNLIFLLNFFKENKK